MTNAFAPDADLILGVFDTVMSAIEAPKAALTAMRAECVEAFQSGDHRLEERLMHRYLKSVEWHWPWFDAWRGRFEAANSWPYLWSEHSDESAPEDLAKERRALLAHVLSMTIYRTRAFRKGRPGWGFRLSPVPDDNEMVGWVDAASRFKPDDLSTWPPYFPGDRTTVMVTPSSC